MSLDGHQLDPALIDPKLLVDWANPDTTGASMGYWPAFDGLTPGARASYLSWLADGRKDPAVYTGYVFLFFYGLERRILSNLMQKTGVSENAVLIREVERLVDLYGDSIGTYAARLISFARAGQATNDIEDPPPRVNSYSYDVPLEIKLGIGRFATERRPLPACWAISLLRTHPNIHLRTPALRCVSLFDELFEIRYRQIHGRGITPKNSGPKLEERYRPASSGIPRHLSRSFGSVRDVTGDNHLAEQLRTLASECTNELDAYSRLLGRQPENADSLEAIALLPRELLASSDSEHLYRLNAWVTDGLNADAFALRSLDDLVELWSAGATRKLDKRQAVSLALILERLGFGIEPDVRFGSRTPKPGTQVVLFKLSTDAASAPTEAYAAAASLVHLSALVAAADGAVTDPERQHLANHLEKALSLDESEKMRLEARLVHLGAAKQTMAGMKKKVASLDSSQLGSVGSFLVGVAAADGIISPQEISSLEKIFPYLGLAESAVYSLVHDLGGSDPGPVQVAAAAEEDRWRIPAEAVDSTTEQSVVTNGPIKLDMAKVRARQQESAVVADLLADIFAEDEGEGTPISRPAAAVVEGASQIEGLDAKHSALARVLVERRTSSREEATIEADRVGLPFIDSALDKINEAAIDICGEPLFEDEAQLELNEYAAEMMIQ